MAKGVDEQKRATLRQFAALGAAFPLAGFVESPASTDSTARDAIVGYVTATPGAHFSKIRDDLSLGTGETQYHLRQLSDRSIVESRRDGEYKRYFRAGVFSEFEQVALGYLRRETPRRMIIAVLRDSTVTASMLADNIGVSPSTISKYGAELRSAGLLVETDSYLVRNAETILVLLIRYADSFDAETVELANNAADFIELVDSSEGN